MADTTGSRAHTPSLGLAALGLVAMLPLLPALWVGFLADDFVGAVLLRKEGWHFVLSQLWPGGGQFLRPVSSTFFGLEGKLLNLEPAALHAVHLLLVFALAWLASRLAARLAGPSAVPWALVLTLWYPAHTEAHVWIAGLFDLLAALLVLAGLFLVLPRANGSARRGVIPWTFAAAFLAPLAKEVGWAFPVILASWWLLGLLPSQPRGTAAKIVAAAFSGTLLTIVYRLAAIGGFGGYPDTGARLIHGLSALPAVALHAVLLPANPSFGPWTVAVNAACAVTALSLAALCAVHGRRRLPGTPLIVAGLTLAVTTVLPVLPYLDPSVFWRNSRYLTLPGIGLSLAAAGCLAGAGRLRKIAGLGLVFSWLAALILATIPWLQAADARGVILSAIGTATRAPGHHTVWIKGPINELDGAHLLGGHLVWAVRYRFPGRKITADSEFFQRYRGARPEPPCHPSGHCHLFHFRPMPPRIEELESEPRHPPTPRIPTSRPPHPTGQLMTVLPTA